MNLIQIGQKLSINFQKEEKLVEILATVEKIYDDRVVINLPSYFMRYIEYLGVGNSVTIKAFSKVGTIDFNAIIINSPLEEEFTVELDYNAMKMTQGEDIPEISAMETLTLERNSEEIFNAKTFEISTEWLKFYCDKCLNIDDDFKCSLILSKNHGTISFVGTIIEIDELYNNEYKMSYSRMNETDRQRLLYYMYLYTNNID